MAEDSDDDTPRDRPRVPRARSVMGDTGRVEVGRRHRDRERDRVARDQVDDLADALSDGAPRAAFDEEFTQPIELREAGPLTLREQELWDRVDRLKAEVRRGRKDTANRITEAMGARPPNERLTTLETRVKIMFAILAAVGSVAAGAAVTVAKGLYERGETDGAHEIRLQNVERAVDSIERQLGQLGLPVHLFPQFTAPKGSTP